MDNGTGTTEETGHDVGRLLRAALAALDHHTNGALAALSTIERHGKAAEKRVRDEAEKVLRLLSNKKPRGPKPGAATFTKIVVPIGSVWPIWTGHGRNKIRWEIEALPDGRYSLNGDQIFNSLRDVGCKIVGKERPIPIRSFFRLGPDGTPLPVDESGPVVKAKPEAPAAEPLPTFDEALAAPEPPEEPEPVTPPPATKPKQQTAAEKRAAKAAEEDEIADLDAILALDVSGADEEPATIEPEAIELAEEPAPVGNNVADPANDPPGTVYSAPGGVEVTKIAARQYSDRASNIAADLEAFGDLRRIRVVSRPEPVAEEPEPVVTKPAPPPEKVARGPGRPKKPAEPVPAVELAADPFASSLADFAELDDLAGFTAPVRKPPPKRRAIG